MALFRRGSKSAAADDAVPQDENVTTPETSSPQSAPTTGPWDVEDAPLDVPRVDLGAVQLPGIEGMELRMELDEASRTVSGVSVALDGSIMQVQAFAAPRTEGIWDEIRTEIAASITQQGGTVDDLPGPFGRELLARMPVRTPEGRTGHRPARFIGADGPRWFLRGVLTGKAAVEPEAASALEQVFAQIVVVRGTDARPPRDLLPLRLPDQSGPAPAGPESGAEPDFDPLRRGPEITEIR